jgi:hypothetical protein
MLCFPETNIRKKIGFEKERKEKRTNLAPVRRI